MSRAKKNGEPATNGKGPDARTDEIVIAEIKASFIENGYWAEDIHPIPGQVLHDQKRRVAERMVSRGEALTKTSLIDDDIVLYPPNADIVIRRKRVNLTDTDVRHLREERERDDARIDVLCRDLETAKARVKAIQGEIDKLTDEGLRRSRTIRDGFDFRDVPCIEHVGPDTRTQSDRKGMGTYSLVDGECVDWRELRPEEAQTEMFA